VVSSTPALSASLFGPLCDRACSQIEISFRVQCRFLARLTDSHISNADGIFAYRNRRSQDNLKIYDLFMTYTGKLLRSSAQSSRVPVGAWLRSGTARGNANEP
jgi:hypothetical protein